ncbi:fibronectin type III domain-containing protein, partial [Candidatus Saccharibacteria bacterium]|nr:fibronectin type III domain-containing protein [Candidatus Saccharibacteria bacterium]
MTTEQPLRWHLYPKGRYAVILISLFLALVLLFVVKMPVQAASWPEAPLSRQSQIDFTCADVTEIPQSECEALVALYSSTNGMNWSNNSGWLMSNTPCDWYGLTCENGHVTKVQLENNQLSGSLPSQLGNLPELFTLYLYENNLTGEIPAELGALTHLDELILFSNALSGAIPPTLGSLAQVRYVLLNNNELTGEIPQELGDLPAVLGLYLQENHLNGPIPPELGNLKTVETLLLFDNRLSGPIPSELGNMTDVQWLHLQSNQLRGVIPSELMQLSQIGPGALILVHNALTATDPVLRTWLDQVAPNWQEIQTVPPTNLTVSAITDNQATLTWAPILYTGNGGYYEISYATHAGGPFTVHGRTADKTVSSYQLTRLTSGNAYYVRIRTFSPSGSWNQNDLWSDYSEVIQLERGSTSVNPLQNGGFETGIAPWLFYTNGKGTFTTAGSAYKGNAAARVQIIKTGSNTQLYQTGF